MIAAYIAASSRQLERAEAARDYARELGLAPFDWMAMVRENLAAGRTDADLTVHEQQRITLRLLRGVADAAVFVMLASAHESEMRVELGYALRCGMPIVISYEGCERPARLFDVLGSHVCGTDRAAVVLAKQLAMGRAEGVR